MKENHFELLKYCSDNGCIKLWNNVYHPAEMKADLRGADLHGMNLRGVNLQDADLREADLRSADLREANLDGADLTGADLRGADFENANLRHADLRLADLQYADFRGVDIQDAKLPDYKVCPDEGDFEAYKAFAGGIIGKVLCSGKRTCNLVSTKVRVARIKPLEFYDTDLSEVMNGGWGAAISTVYKINKWTVCSEFSEDIRVACSPGIHVFMSREEAEEWSSI
jgi:hypothetical protein